MPKGGRSGPKASTREQLEKEGHVRLNLAKGPFLPFAKAASPQPVVRQSFYSASLAAQGMDPVVAFVPLKNHACQKGQRNFAGAAFAQS